MKKYLRYLRNAFKNQDKERASDEKINFFIDCIYAFACFYRVRCKNNRLIGGFPADVRGDKSPSVITGPNIFAGEYTYYVDINEAEKFEAHDSQHYYLSNTVLKKFVLVDTQ